MRRLVVPTLLLAALVLPARAERQTLSFNPDWRFIKQDVDGAQSPSFDDLKWTTVSCPHTYNDIDTFDDFSLSGHRGEQNQWGGRTWYRKTFTAPAEWAGKKVFIEFEAVRQVADVYLNGVKLGTCKTGFTPFGFDLTPHLNLGQKNVLAVHVDNRFMKDPYAADGASKAPNGPKPPGGLLHQLQQEFNASIPDSIDDLQPDQIPWNNPHWHPAHGGIYRNVKLTVTDPLHIELPLYSFLQTAGPYLYATDVSDKAATVHIEVPVQNERKDPADIEVTADVLDRDGKTIATLKQRGHIDPGARSESKLAITLPNPHLWESSYPYLYKISITVRANGHPVDSVVLPLGIRTVRWDKDHGFFINGHHEKLHGWGQKPTDEWPGLGNAQPDWLHYFTLNLMKDAGGNWVRWGHCAAGPAQITSCDRLGIMVEQPGVDGESDTVKAAWKLRASAFRDAIIYYRNHPSIMIWEGGNQKVTADHAKELRGLMETYDPHGGRVYAHRRSDKTTAQFEDVLVGTEGGREFPNLPVVEGEYDREESPRRVWDDQTPRPSSTDPSQTVLGYPEAKGMTYQLTGEQFAVNQVSHWLKKCGAENHSGGANWIFSDSTSGGRVPAEVSRASGEVDGVRLPKDAYYVCQTLFDNHPRTHILGHWNYPAGTTKTVYVVSNCADEIELLLNGKSLGKSKPENNYLFAFPNIPFEPGTLEARPISLQSAIRNPQSAILITAGPPHHIELTPIASPTGFLANGSDVLLVDAEVVDADGNRCRTFYGPITFSPSGPAIYRGGYNSGKEHSTNNTTLDLECGINRISLRSTLTPGTIRLTAQVPGLPPATLEIDAKPTSLTDLPALPVPSLSSSIPQFEFRNPQLTTSPDSTPAAGSLITGFSYTGPGKPFTIRPLTNSHAPIYSDQPDTFTDLPANLLGGEYLLLPNADRNYSALDLIQFTAAKDLDLYIAHDDRLPRPTWLTSSFADTGQKLNLPGTTATLFKRALKKDASLTLGGNTDSQFTGPSALYVVIAVPHCDDVKSLDRARVLHQADEFLHQAPTPITDFHADRSAGGPHDYFSEGDYWWPDPKNPAGPYVQRDGMTNPDNFIAHRHAMMQMSIQSCALAAAYELTGDAKYADHAIAHWHAWFVDPATRMNPNLQYAQAIHGITTGRGIGVIDTLHLVEVARAIQVLEKHGTIKPDDAKAIKQWFADYLTWMTTSKNGQDEMNAKNNHGTCWVAQVAAFASLTADQEKLAFCRKRFKEVLLPNQLAQDGSFPLELKRTKPYGYSLFNLDAMTTVAEILSTPDDNLWSFAVPTGQTLHNAVEFMYPYIRGKSTWPHKPDVMFWEFWPVRCPSLLFASRAYSQPKYFELWKTLEASPTNEEVLRNLPIRQPVLWD